MFWKRLKYNMTGYGVILAFGTTLLLGLYSIAESLQNLPIDYPDTPYGISELPPAFMPFLINIGNVNFSLYKLLFPILALLPGTFLYAKEAHAGSDIYFILRKHKQAYYWSTLGIAFISTFFAIALPLILSSGISHLILPEFSVYDGASYWRIIDQYITDGSFQMLLPGVMINSPFASTILISLATGFLAAIYGCFMLVISFYIPRDSVSGQITLILPIFIFSQVTDTLGKATGYQKYNPLDLIALCTSSLGSKHYVLLAILIVVGLLVIVGGTVLRSRREVL